MSTHDTPSEESFENNDANKELFDETFSVEIDYSKSIKNMMEESGIYYNPKWHADYETIFHYRMPKEGRVKVEMKLVPMPKGEVNIDDFIERILSSGSKGASFEHLLALAKKYPLIHEKIAIFALGGRCFTEAEDETPEDKAIPLWPILGKRVSEEGRSNKVISLTIGPLGLTDVLNTDFAGLIIVSEEKN